MIKIDVATGDNKQMIDITRRIKKVLEDNKWQDGILTIFVPHTTAAVTINENADPDVEFDILQYVQDMVPRHAPFRHAEGNSDAHILASFFGSSCRVIVEEGKMQMGQWQSIFFCEFDGPRNRKIWVKFIGE